jgi:phage-related minor tail protein
MSFVDSTDPNQAGDTLGTTIDGLTSKTDGLGVSANSFAKAMAKAFTDATSGAKSFDDALKSLALKLSSLTLQQALKPLAQDLSKGLSGIFGGIFGGGGSGGGLNLGSIMPFAAGGVIGTPSYFPMSGGALGLAGEAGPEAIMPLARASDGSLGVAMAGAGGPSNITVQIATPDVSSFRRSETYLTGQIARAVARGQRGL